MTVLSTVDLVDHDSKFGNVHALDSFSVSVEQEQS